MNLDEGALARLSAWLNQMSLAGLGEAELVGAFCARLEQLGVPLTRGTVLIDTLHPVHEGRVPVDDRWRTG
jgi:adenylate cyclase